MSAPPTARRLHEDLRDRRPARERRDSSRIAGRAARRPRSRGAPARRSASSARPSCRTSRTRRALHEEGHVARSRSSRWICVATLSTPAPFVLISAPWIGAIGERVREGVVDEPVLLDSERPSNARLRPSPGSGRRRRAVALTATSSPGTRARGAELLAGRSVRPRRRCARYSSRSERVSMPVGLPRVGHDDRGLPAAQAREDLVDRLVRVDRRERRLHRGGDVLVAARPGSGTRGRATPRSCSEPTTSASEPDEPSRARPAAARSSSAASGRSPAPTFWCDSIVTSSGSVALAAASSAAPRAPSGPARRARGSRARASSCRRRTSRGRRGRRRGRA